MIRNCPRSFMPMTGHARSRPAESRQASSRARIASATKAVCGKRAGTRKAPSGSLTLQCSKGTAIKPESIIEGRGICPHGLLTTPASRAGVVFCLAGGVLMKLRATDGLSVALFQCALNLKHTTKTRGSRPRRRHTLLLACKSMQKTTCAALGMSGSISRRPQCRPDYGTK